MNEILQMNQRSRDSASCLIIMPIYNRRNFLKQAFQSLRQQTFQNWKLVVVDDGSTDEPLVELRSLANQTPQPVTYLKKNNGGPGSARAAGQKLICNEEFVAFFDSDDYWLPDYLQALIGELERIQEMDWVYCPCRRVDHESGKTLNESTFLDEVSKEPLGFRRLDHLRYGNTHLITNNNKLVLMQLKEPINAGFQNSVFRATLINEIEIPDYRIGEDRYFLVAALLKGFRVGYINDVHVIYNVHDNNISDTNLRKNDVEKAVLVQNELCRALGGIKRLTKIKPILTEVDHQVANIRFWLIGYNYYWRNGFVGKALYTMLKVLIGEPKNLRFIKTFLVSIIKAPIQYLACCKRSSDTHG